MDPDALRRCLDLGLAELDTAIDRRVTDEARDRMIAYLALLTRWNLAFNLTAVRDPMAMVPRHLLDSLAILPWISQGPVLDIGTGPGLPGIPLALVNPDLDFTLLDSNGKKTRFVCQAIADLGITNVRVVQDRAETYRPARKFATIVARAVASLATLRAVAAHLAAEHGALLALKGRVQAHEMDELTAITAADAPTAIAVHQLRVPFTEGERNLIVIPFDTQTHG
jgi:16S rRNA (guanine527-N7)-methyltransferase